MRYVERLLRRALALPRDSSPYLFDPFEQTAILAAPEDVQEASCRSSLSPAVPLEASTAGRPAEPPAPVEQPEAGRPRLPQPLTSRNSSAPGPVRSTAAKFARPEEADLEPRLIPDTRSVAPALPPEEYSDPAPPRREPRTQKRSARHEDRLTPPAPKVAPALASGPIEARPQAPRRAALPLAPEAPRAPPAAIKRQERPAPPFEGASRSSAERPSQARAKPAGKAPPAPVPVRVRHMLVGRRTSDPRDDLSQARAIRRFGIGQS